MGWCNGCLVDHEGPCIDERRRRELRGALDGLLGKGARVCPYCGVEEPFCPVLAPGSTVQAPASSPRTCPLRSCHLAEVAVASPQ